MSQNVSVFHFFFSADRSQTCQCMYVMDGGLHKVLTLGATALLAKNNSVKIVR